MVAISSSRGIFLTQGLNPRLMHLLALAASSFTTEPPGKPPARSRCPVMFADCSGSLTQHALLSSLLQRVENKNHRGLTAQENPKKV